MKMIEMLSNEVRVDQAILTGMPGVCVCARACVFRTELLNVCNWDYFQLPLMCLQIVKLYHITMY
jgi:hypothetical protein